MDSTSPSASMRATAAAIVRVSFGLSLVCVGLIHYMQFASFQLVVRDGLGPLDVLGVVWAFLLPALLILGGGLFALNFGMELAVWLIAVALGSIPPGMLLKSVLTSIDLSDMMAAANNAFIWLGVFLLIVVLSNVPTPAKATLPAVQTKKPTTPVKVSTTKIGAKK